MLSKVVREVMVVISMAILQMEETITPVTTVEMEVLPSATMATVVMEALQLVVSLSPVSTVTMHSHRKTRVSCPLLLVL